MPTEIIKVEDDIIRDEEFISIMDDDDSFRSLSEIVDEIRLELWAQFIRCIE